LIRQQFGPPNQPEISILDYQSQQQKLMPLLSCAYAFHFATEYLVRFLIFFVFHVVTDMVSLLVLVISSAWQPL
jgi:hypothetical protein